MDQRAGLGDAPVLQNLTCHARGEQQSRTAGVGGVGGEERGRSIRFPPISGGLFVRTGRVKMKDHFLV